MFMYIASRAMLAKAGMLMSFAGRAMQVGTKAGMLMYIAGRAMLAKAGMLMYIAGSDRYVNMCCNVHCVCCCVAYIYIRGEFYNEASNMQIAIQEVSLNNSCTHYTHIIHHNCHWIITCVHCCM